MCRLLYGRHRPPGGESRPVLLSSYTWAVLFAEYSRTLRTPAPWSPRAERDNAKNNEHGVICAGILVELVASDYALSDGLESSCYSVTVLVDHAVTRPFGCIRNYLCHRQQGPSAATCCPF